MANLNTPVSRRTALKGGALASAAAAGATLLGPVGQPVAAPADETTPETANTSDIAYQPAGTASFAPKAKRPRRAPTSSSM